MGKKRRIVLAALLLAFGGAVCWLYRPAGDPLFRGKPESDWIAHLAYHDEAQVKQWREFGPDGVRVLMRGLEHADHPFERAYRKAYRKLQPVFGRLLPPPRMDATRPTRMTVCSLLADLGQDAIIATPSMTCELRDEAPSVRAIALNFFTWPEDQNAILNHTDKKEKRKLLPLFLDAMQDGDWSVRNNAAVALGFYPEEAPTVVLVLVKALQDPDTHVVHAAGAALKRIDPKAAAQAGVK